MKKLSILALALLASSVFANGGSNGGNRYFGNVIFVMRYSCVRM